MKPDESAIAYTKELIKRIEASLKKVKAAETPGDVSAQERAFYPVLREIQLVVPRIGDEFMRAGRKRRQEIRDEA